MPKVRTKNKNYTRDDSQKHAKDVLCYNCDKETVVTSPGVFYAYCTTCQKPLDWTKILAHNKV